MAHQRLVEREPGFVGEGGDAGGADRRRALVVAREPARDGEVVEDVEQVFLAALVGRAVALDQPAALGDLGAENGVAARRGGDAVEPALDRRLLGGEAAAVPAQRARRGEGAQERKPNTVSVRILSGSANGSRPRATRLRSQRTSAAARRRGSSPASSATPGLK